MTCSDHIGTHYSHSVYLFDLEANYYGPESPGLSLSLEHINTSVTLSSLTHTGEANALLLIHVPVSLLEMEDYWN